MGSGWLPVPCSCELWPENDTTAPVTVAIDLTVTPPEEVPSLDGSLDVEIAFEDPDASWYDRWTTQAGNGVAFAVTHEGDATTVRLGQGSVELAPVPLAGCETRKGAAQVLGSLSAVLKAKATLDDGAAFTMNCLNPPPQG
jgi:hypothetical protein